MGEYRRNAKGEAMVTKEDMIKIVAKKMGATIVSVKEVWANIEETLFDEFRKSHLRGEEVTIKCFEGITFQTSKVGAKQVKNNFTGQTVTTDPYTRIKCNITRTLRDKVNNSEEPGELLDLEAIENLKFR